VSSVPTLGGLLSGLPYLPPGFGSIIGNMPLPGFSNPNAGDPTRSRTAWIDNATMRIAQNVLYNPSASGKPGEWDDAKYGSWDALVKRNQGKQTMSAGDLATIRRYVQDITAKYNGPIPGSYLAEVMPAFPQEDSGSSGGGAFGGAEFTGSLGELASLLGTLLSYTVQMRSLDVQQRGQDLEYIARLKAIEADLRAQQMRSVTDLQVAAMNTSVQWKIAQLESNTRLTLQARELAWDQIKTRVQAEFELAKFRLEQERFNFEKDLAVMQEKTRRGQIIAQLSANPNDLVAREYFLRMGQEPQGTMVGLFSGSNLGQGTQSQALGLGAGVIPGYFTGPGNPDTSPTNVLPPGMAEGGYTTSRAFIVGDSPSGKPTGYEEIVVNPTGAPLAVIPSKILYGGGA